MGFFPVGESYGPLVRMENTNYSAIKLLEIPRIIEKEHELKVDDRLKY